MHVFHNILDLAAINTWILYKEMTGEKISRKDFLFELVNELANEHRISPNEQLQLKALTSNKESTNVRKWCQSGNCNIQSNICITCKKYICGKCTKRKMYICKKCDE